VKLQAITVVAPVHLTLAVQSVASKHISEEKLDHRALLFGTRLGRDSNHASERGQKLAKFYAAAERAALEQKNDECIDQLSSKVSMLHDVSLDIDQEVESSNQSIAAMNLEEAQGLLSNVSVRVRQAGKGTEGRGMCWIIVFAIVGLLAIYLMVTQGRSGKVGSAFLANGVRGSADGSMSASKP